MRERVKVSESEKDSERERIQFLPQNLPVRTPACTLSLLSDHKLDFNDSTLLLLPLGLALILPT